MNILVATVDHKAQRYPTVGDWLFDGLGNLTVLVSDMNNDDYEFLVAMHETIEAYLCRKRGIKEEDVTAFDVAFEAARTADNTDEPGNDTAAPYYKEHQIATYIEKLLADQLGVDWKIYDKAVNDL